MAQEIIIPDIIAFVLFGVIFGGFLGIILAFIFSMVTFVYAGLIGGVISGVMVHWLVKHNVQFFQESRSMPDPAPIAAPLPDLQHIVNSFERIFQSWAGHSNFVAACFVGVVIVIAVMAIKITKINVEARQPYDPRYHDHVWPPPLPPGLERYYQPRQLEGPKEEHRSNLPAVRTHHDG